MLAIHLGVLTQGPAWWSPMADKQQPLSFVARQIHVTSQPSQPKSRATETAQRTAENKLRMNETGTPDHAAPATTQAVSQTPHRDDAQPAAHQPLNVDALPPNLTAPVALPERAASAVDLPPFQRSTSEGQSEPTATQAPPSTTLSYAVSGKAKGLDYHAKAVLQWKNSEERYEASLEVGAFLLGSRTQTSTGRLSTEGLMPERFSDKTRSELAVHFQRDKGIISFSANTPEVPLLKGAQDRLSVVLQLSALLAGDPMRYPVGTMLSFQTVSQREAEVWQFKVMNEETLNLPYGDLPSLKLQRNPRRDFDQRIEVWFAPALGYLPVRLRITNANGDTVDQLLRSVAPRTP